MSRTLLTVERVGKSYVDYGSNLKRFASWFGVKVARKSEYWAVHDVTFELGAGDTLGVIGQNGAGKSTLLKLITGTVRPSTGKIAVAGRVSAILELGLGFNPEFSGRQNVYQAGGLMGMSERDLTGLMPEIEEFAELGEFFDHPLRTYSSGMQARLAFSLATAVRPDLLIVDEVLSVGDSYFQHKSFDRIRQFKEQGTAIVLVTHGLGDVRVLCNRVLLLDKGKVVRDGLPDEIIDYYNAIIAEKENAKLSIEQRRSRGWLKTKSGTGEIKVVDIKLIDADTQAEVANVRVGQKVEFHLTAQVYCSVPRLVVGFMIRDRVGNVIWGTNTWYTHQVEDDLISGEHVECILRITSDLGPGSYSLTYALVSDQSHLTNNYEWHDNALVFDIINVDNQYFIGVANLPAYIEVRRNYMEEDPNNLRVAMTTGCRDCDPIPKVDRAGDIVSENGQLVQIMHNGLRVVAGGYYGNWMARIIGGLHGHHEPQEELIFNALLRHVRPDSLMVELGCFWAYYTLWYLLKIPGSSALCVEPDRQNIEVGRKNAALNGLSDRVTFVEAWVGCSANKTKMGVTESAGELRTLPCLDMTEVLDRAGGRTIELLHIDAQGAEADFISSMGEAVKGGGRPIRFLVVSTHHRLITGRADTHNECLDLVRSFGGHVIVEHSVHESFSGDGLVVASFIESDRGLPMPAITRNIALKSLFPDP